MFEPFQQRGPRQEEIDRERGGTAARYWEEFARSHARDLGRCVAATMRRIGWRPEPSEVDELVQEVYCRLLDGRLPAGIEGWSRTQLWGYLQRVVRNVMVDEVRSRCARKRGGAPQGEPSAVHETNGPTLGERRAPGPTPEERLIDRERARALRRRVCELGGPEHGPRNLRILELAAVEGCTAAEISRRLAGALSASTVHTIIHRLRRQLAEPAVSAAAG